jgi:hypothetical protein
VLAALKAVPFKAGRQLLNSELATQLCELPGAEQISSEVLGPLIQSAVEYNGVSCLQQLWQLLADKPLTQLPSNEQLLDVPAVPLDCAKQLVSAGVRISYAELLAAANAMVAGVEVWVQAQQQLGIASDIPAAAVAICSGHDWVSGVNQRYH